MANNRMYLSCRQCKKDGAEWKDRVIFLAKYYQGPGYYTNTEGFQDKFDKWMDDHNHHGDLDEWPFELEYETSEKRSNEITAEVMAQVKS